MLRTLRPRAGAMAPKVQPQRTERMRGSSWMALRDRVLRRDAGLCRECDRSGRLTLATEVDHIRPLSEGGTDEMRNLQALCADCHRAKTAAEADPLRSSRTA